jgi:hypothetical protein
MYVVASRGLPVVGMSHRFIALRHCIALRAR